MRRERISGFVDANKQATVMVIENER